MIQRLSWMDSAALLDLSSWFLSPSPAWRGGVLEKEEGERQRYDSRGAAEPIADTEMQTA